MMRMKRSLWVEGLGFTDWVCDLRLTVGFNLKRTDHGQILGIVQASTFGSGPRNWDLWNGGFRVWGPRGLGVRVRVLSSGLFGGVG